jgi:(p)ppGpp synthase/HD superfamily hydrolase
VTGPLEPRAEQIAREAHGDARNKHSGERYILHVERVVTHLRKMGADDLTLAVAWLHDVVEDTAVTLADLAGQFGDDLVSAVDAITHRFGETRLAYYARVGANRVALCVKMSDLRDNTDPERRAVLPEQTRRRLDEKYKIAHRALIPHIIEHLEH